MNLSNDAVLKILQISQQTLSTTCLVCHCLALKVGIKLEMLEVKPKTGQSGK